jgi:mannose/fructose-specific phosphotransferase system component IIA
VLAGVNLPMLMKAASLRNEHLPLHDLAESLITYAQRNIRFASELVRDAAGRHVALEETVRRLPTVRPVRGPEPT